MNRWLLILIICLCALAGSFFYYFAANDPGYLLIAYRGQAIEMTLLFAMLSLVVVLIALRIILSLLSALFSLGESKAEKLTNRGLLAFIEGNWSVASRYLAKGAKGTPAPIVNYLLAVQSALKLGDDNLVQNYLKKAENNNAKNHLAVVLTQVSYLLAQEHFEQALAMLKRVSDEQQRHPEVLNLKRQVYIALNDWYALKELLPALQRHRVLTENEVYQLEIQCYVALLSESTDAKEHSVKETVDSVESIWADVHRKLRQEQRVFTCYIKQLLMLKQSDRAEPLIVKALDRQWCPEWVLLYGQLDCSQPKVPLKYAEQWLKRHGQSSELLYALGLLCIKNQQWGRALDFLEQSIVLEKSVSTYIELATLLKNTGESQRSAEYYRQGVLYAARQLNTFSEKELNKI